MSVSLECCLVRGTHLGTDDRFPSYLLSQCLGHQCTINCCLSVFGNKLIYFESEWLEKNKEQFGINTSIVKVILNITCWDFPGGPVVKTSPSSAGGAGSIPGQGAKIPHASQPGNQKVKQKQYCNKFNKDFKNGPHQKNL